jgi:hypothetical protein
MQAQLAKDGSNIEGVSLCETGYNSVFVSSKNSYQYASAGGVINRFRKFFTTNHDIGVNESFFNKFVRKVAISRKY